MLRKFLLACGIFSSIYYVAINIIVPLYYPGYNPASQAISELSAIGAPTKTLWTWLASFYTLLVIAFGWGLWQSSTGNKSLRVVSILMIIYGLSGFIWTPMHQREVIAAGGGSWTDDWHLVVGFLSLGLILLMFGFGAASFGKRFRIYSILSILAFFVFGILTGIESPGIQENRPTPLLGVWERLTLGAYMGWVIVLAAATLQAKRNKVQVRLRQHTVKRNKVVNY
ncbi:MAG TPA: DUF998 domain-containing protein [Chitinophagaceae bacterium]|nr:DUF998 domain-containing protein [Chitinophagaceae bacterium]